MKERLKKYNIPILVLALLVLIGGFGYIVYDYSNLFVNNQNAVVDDTKPEIKDEKKEETIKEPDHTLINGYWKTEILEDGRFLEFTINYPEVTNFNGMKGPVEYNAEQKRYAVILKDETGESEFYIGEINNNTGKVFYYETDDGEELFLALNRDPETAPENVIDNPTEQKPETAQNTANNYGNTKPSNNSNTNTNSSSSQTNTSTASSNTSENKKGHYEERQVLVREAWDEQVETGCTQVCVQEAYDTQEMVYLEGAYYGPDREVVGICNQCGAIWTDDHMSETHRSWHTESRDISEPYWHNVDYRTVHHDAVYETRCTYETVHHEAEYRTEKVWVED